MTMGTTRECASTSYLPFYKSSHTPNKVVCVLCVTHIHTCMYVCAQHLYTYCNTRARVARPTVCGMWPHIHYMCT